MEARDDVVRYRLQRAREALEDARVLANAGRWSACVNRLYYACFYAVSALLFQDGLSSTKHTVITWISSKSKPCKFVPGLQGPSSWSSMLPP